MNFMITKVINKEIQDTQVLKDFKDKIFNYSNLDFT